MTTRTIAIPSKGRLMEQSNEVFERAGLKIERFGTERGYRGRLLGIDGIEIAFQSASEIAANLKDGKIDAGITGEDLLREAISPGVDGVDVALRLNFGAADVVVAVPECWLDVAVMAD
ncbi:MAG: ATP phosphoribosyltransferase, partial [Alphaproteobacteria bacterium]|nr:ATP phosphoribosyltransferase [Alphaproteobacteria bacterium]